MADMRIGVGSIFQESNQFAATQTDLSLFRNSYVHEGDTLLQLAGPDCEVAGMLATCQAAGAQVVPVPTQSRQQTYEEELVAFVATLRGQQPPDRSPEHELLVQETLLRLTGRIADS